MGNSSVGPSGVPKALLRCGYLCVDDVGSRCLDCVKCETWGTERCGELGIAELISIFVEQTGNNRGADCE